MSIDIHEVMEDLPAYEPKSAYFRGIPIEELSLDELRRAFTLVTKLAISHSKPRTVRELMEADVAREMAKVVEDVNR